MEVLVGLLDPLEVKGLRLNNRIVMPPMYTGLATSKEAVTEELIEHYVQRAEALGLLIIEHSYVSMEGRLSERQLGIYDDFLISGLEKLSSKIHAEGKPVVLQINHAGREASKEITGMTPVAPSPSGNARELSVTEIEALIEKYVSAARRAMKAGYDGVEVHGAHGFLLNQFYSPLTNKRSDRYGGTLEDRIRFPLEIVKKVRETIGERLLLYRLGSVDLDPAGTQIEESRKFALELQRAGVDIIDVSGGLCGSRPAQLEGTSGYFIPQAYEIREILDVPVIGVGGITDPIYANKILQEEKVDLVAVGRALYNDPNWATKAIERLST